MSTDFDIAIIGAGPAGATLARLVAPHFRVVVFDRKASVPAEPSFHKPCGGLLAEDAQRALSRQNLALPKSVLADPQIFEVRTIDFAQNLERTYRRFYINMDRHKFDLWLKSLVPASAEMHNCSTVRKISRDGNAWRIDFYENGVEKSVTASVVVGADGAASKVRQTLVPAHKIRYYNAIQQWFADKNPRGIYACFFDQRLTDCYGWAVSKDGKIVFGAAFPPKNSKKAYDELLTRARERGFELGEPLATEACQVLRPERARDFVLGNGQNAFLIGEAAGFISPSSLEGMSYALDSAEILAKILIENGDPAEFVPAKSTRKEAKFPTSPIENLPNDKILNSEVKNFASLRANVPAESPIFNPQKLFSEYKKRSRKLRLKLIGKILKNPFMYNPFLRKIVMKTGVSAEK